MRRTRAVQRWIGGRGSRDGAAVVAVALLTLVGLAALPAAAQEATPEPVATGPVEVDGDPLIGLVPVNPQAVAIYAVGAEGLYRTDSGGQQWELAGPIPPAETVIVAEDSPLVLLAGDMPNCARGDEAEALSRSGDGGATWETIEGIAGVRPLAIWREAELAVGASCGGMMISTDTGRTWQQVPLTESNFEVTAFAAVPTGDPTRPQALIGGTSEGGTSRLWLADFADPTNPTLSEPLKEYWGIGVLAAAERFFLLGAADGAWVSIDNGATWKQRRNGLEDVTLEADPLIEGVPENVEPGSFGLTAVAIDPGEFGRLHVGTPDGVYVTDDAGGIWTRVEGIDGAVSVLVVAPKGDRFFAETEDGVVQAPLVY